MGKASKKAARRQARQERRVQEEAQLRRGRQTRRLLLVGGALALIVLVGWVVWTFTRPGPTTSSSQPAGTTQTGATQPPAAPTPERPQIIQVALQGTEHVAPGTAHPAYNSNPPTSGWHYALTAPWGFHTSSLQDELLIHNLEHGGIWISYKDETDTEVVDALVALAREFPRKLVITHRPKNDSRIAVAAWGQLMKLSAYDRGAIVDFYNRFKNKGPERVPD